MFGPNVPKPGGVKKGWMRQFVVVCDFKLFLYDISQDSQVLDMRDPEFSVTSVKESDVIHASKRDIPCIFRISTSQLEGGKRSHTLMLAESESEKTKWVVALSELHRILKRNNLPDKCVYSACVVVEGGGSACSALRGAMCACVVEGARVVVGGDAGLALLDLERGELTPRRHHAPVARLLYVLSEQLLVVIAGRGRHVRLVPIRALECSEVECVKLAESKGAVDIAAGELHASAYGFAVVCKRQVTICTIHGTKINIALKKITDIDGGKVCSGRNLTIATGSSVIPRLTLSSRHLQMHFFHL
ncbi:unnamed protein product [Diatraea saccharalis]|uniref:PH domain-containing protein n=1 Tax=Diatraea saccharalis TaxID=40085 RepID=A0A9N9R624_9NEOP|nr:unnamed protein product [Diatraea saccharalis]